VKTTPKPSATKKSNGELVGLESLPSGLCVGVGVDVDELVLVDVGMMVMAQPP
jgi:hypothetical protein